ncbi:alkaline phosphatase PafA [Galbibacter mesophilus]|uniref:alkaline phosphatase PafA n=1 Tax=Galbibacter mesophilus TaxID=379069 RepID=UPI00191E957B|nr:alkaline phosphatase PafA [Galbibacter mesophilus]MCM5664391.1 alkaline phosphatase family protein [Galbibacter mesophilus]
MKNIFLVGAFFFANLALLAQQKKEEKPFTRPKLVVGIVVDQMRYDYLTRFWDQYGEGGFKRMVNEGFNCKNNHFNYIPTKTAAGHASVYTGATPKVHGIIGNDWYDKTEDRMVYCTEDGVVESLGTDSDAGKMSPRRMVASTMTDQLKLATVSRGKVIGISLKDRGSILPAGHAADGAYWFHGKKEGHWVTSTYYMEKLPKWVKKFNDSDAAEKYKKVWNPLYDIETYTASIEDDNEFEGTFSGEKKPTFPHDLPKLWKDNGRFDLLKGVPFGNSLTTDFAEAAIEGEDLGKDDITDFLAVSFSATDYVGHRFGVSAKETQDTYLRLDQDLERFFAFLDNKVGKGEYTVFLTADHAAVEVPSYLESMEIPGGYFSKKDFIDSLTEFLDDTFGSDKLIKNFSNEQIFLDQKEIKKLGISSAEVENAIVTEIKNYKHITEAYSGTDLRNQEFTDGLANRLQKGYHFKRSGDVLVVLDPGFINSTNRKGTTHGSGHAYDTHTPLLFFGKGINHGATVRRTEIPDIANTVCALLGITFPSGKSGEPIWEVIE